jgi:ankyrin repeat protein
LQEALATSQQAILKGNIRELRQNLSRKIYSQGRDEVGRSLLHQAVLYNRQDIVEYLIENYPYLINYKDNVSSHRPFDYMFFTPLHHVHGVRKTGCPQISKKKMFYFFRGN